MSRHILAAFLLAILIIGPIAGESLAQPKQQTPVAEQGNPADQDVPGDLRPGDAFGEEITLSKQTIIYIKGRANWETAFGTLVDSFKSLHDYFDKQGLKTNGPAITIYTTTDETGFQFQAALPVTEAPKDAPKGDIAVGETFAGKALKFVHRGSYDAMDTTYEAITNYLDDKNLEAESLFIEEYTTDPTKTKPGELVVNVFVPIKQ